MWFTTSSSIHPRYVFFCSSSIVEFNVNIVTGDKKFSLVPVFSILRIGFALKKGRKNLARESNRKTKNLVSVSDDRYAVSNGSGYAVLICLSEYAVLDRGLDTPYLMEVDTPYSAIDQNSMVPYEAFACPCGAGDVVLRELYKPKTRGKLYYACPRSKPRQKHFRMEFFMERGNESPSTSMFLLELQRLLFNSLGSSSTLLYPRSSTLTSLSPGASTPQSYSLGTSRNAECSNCKHLLGKITVLEATVDMYMHLKQHTVNPAALFHEVYNNMGKLDLE
ncbi:hypothetical protein Tco_0383609 [Tanacetum coccineum]